MGMRLMEITYAQFDEFAQQHALSNYCQTSKYALVMSEYGYNYDYIGLIDDNNKIQAASLILTKSLTPYTKYGYAPKGFLINYYDKLLLEEFLKQLRQHYRKKNYIFIKFNPEVIIADTTSKQNYSMKYNGNVRIIDDLKTMHVKRRVELKEFDFMQPKFNAYLNLKTYDYHNLTRSYRKKINQALNRGLSLTIAGPKDIEYLYSYLKDKKNRPLSYYRNFYNVFSRDNSIDLVYIKVDYQSFLTYERKRYDDEQYNNDYWNQMIQRHPTRKNLNRKMDSDKKLQTFKSNILKATEGLKKNPTEYVAGALVIKHFNRVSIIVSGYKEEAGYLDPNHLLYHLIFERYKPYFDYCDMNGVTGVFNETSSYYGLNQFKLGFNPTIFEFAGEFDLVCSDLIFNRLIKTSFVEDEFTKKK